MKNRTLSTIGLWVVVGLVIWVGGFFSVAEQASFGLLALIICAAQYEFYQLIRAIPGVGRPHLSGIIAGFALHFGLFFLAAEEARSNYLLTGGALLVGLHLLSLLRHPTEVPTLLRRFPTLYGFAYLPFMLASLIAIARMKDGHLLTAQSVGLYYVVWVFVATKFTDVGGLMIGVPFGKHKIAPTISPAKSWEGCLGGLAASAGASALFAWMLRDIVGIAFDIGAEIQHDRLAPLGGHERGERRSVRTFEHAHGNHGDGQQGAGISGRHHRVGAPLGGGVDCQPHARLAAAA